MGMKEEIVEERQERLLPWIAVDPFRHDYHHAQHGSSSHSKDSRKNNAQGVEFAFGPRRMTLQEEQEQEKERQEATPIELFYDLFFVANLTTVTSVHYITENRSLASYGLFFIILWFTWLHVTLLDVRFSVDSVYERICKSVHFLVMAVFSSVSTQWNPLDPTDEHTVQALRTMTLALMFSRFVLMFQYFIVMLFAKAKGRAMLPLALHSLTMGLAGGIYLGLYFAFEKGNPAKSYIGWYITAIFEVICVIGVSSIWRMATLEWVKCFGDPAPWRVVSFEHTHLVERMGLLTLIILGEGIIVMLKAINAIVKGTEWNGSLAGVVIAALSIIYLLWMFYFDYNPKHGQYGVIKQQFWTLLHFPFHLSIVLAVEGLRQLSTWHGLNTYISVLLLEIANLNHPQEVADWFLDNFTGLYLDGSSKTVVKSWEIITANITTLVSLGTDEATAETEYIHGVNTLLSELLIGVSEYYGMKAAKPKKGSHSEASYTPEGQLELVVGVFNLVFEYFFVAMGTVFIVFAAFTFLVRPRRSIHDYLAISIRVMVAVAMYAMVGLYTIGSTEVYSDYLYSPWPVPQVCFILSIALVVDKTLNYIAYRRAKVHLKGSERFETVPLHDRNEGWDSRQGMYHTPGDDGMSTKSSISTTSASATLFGGGTSPAYYQHLHQQGGY